MIKEEIHMGKLTFKGGVHPYDGKELSKNSPIENICRKAKWYIPCPSISELLLFPA